MTETIEEVVYDDPLLPQKSNFRVDEVARYFDVTEACIRIWIDHGILQKVKIRGILRVPRESIIHCRFAEIAKKQI